MNRNGRAREFTVRLREPVVKNRASLVAREDTLVRARSFFVYFRRVVRRYTARPPTGNERVRHHRLHRHCGAMAKDRLAP